MATKDGKKNVAIDSSLHRVAKIAATQDGDDLQDWVAEAIRQRLHSRALRVERGRG